MRKLQFNTYLKIYLLILFFFAVFFFFQKYNNSVEWTISEWLINYQGGFTRRGLLGELIFQFSNIIGITIREGILTFQILTYIIYFFLIYYFLRNIDTNWILIFAIFSPLFLSYPIAEVEVLGRKEIFVFISFLVIIMMFSSENFKNKYYIYYSLILTILFLIWEGVFIYLSYFIFILLIKNNFILNKNLFLKIIFCFFPVSIAFYFIVTQRLNTNEINIMCESIGECYGAITYLNRDISSNISEVVSKFQTSYLIRYILILIVGYFPLILLLTKSEFNLKFKNNNKFLVLFSFILLFLPTISFFYIAQDWGRWINISYTLSLFTYIYCLKKNSIITNLRAISYPILNKRFITTLLFVIFCFGWSPKTLINEDVSSIPLYRKSLNIIKSLY